MAHVADHHTHEDPLFPECQHQELKKKWLGEGKGRFILYLKSPLIHRPHFTIHRTLVAGTPAYKKLKEIVLSKQLLRDIPRLSPSAQTFATECFHSTLLQFAPKLLHYSFRSMTARYAKRPVVSSPGVFKSRFDFLGPTWQPCISTSREKGHRPLRRQGKRGIPSSTQKPGRRQFLLDSRETAHTVHTTAQISALLVQHLELVQLSHCRVCGGAYGSCPGNLHHHAILQGRCCSLQPGCTSLPLSCFRTWGQTGTSGKASLKVSAMKCS